MISNRCLWMSCGLSKGPIEPSLRRARRISGRNGKESSGLTNTAAGLPPNSALRSTGPMTKAVDDDWLPTIKRSHEASNGFPERPRPPRCRALLCPAHDDGWRRARPDHRNGGPESRPGGTGRQARRAARRLHADRVDRFRRDRFPDSMQGVHRPGARQGGGADSAGRSRKPATADEKPAAEPKPAVVQEKPAARESEAGAPAQDATPEISKPADKPAEAAAMPQRADPDPRKRATRSGAARTTGPMMRSRDLPGL